MAPPIVAKRDDHQNLPMPPETSEIEIGVELTSDEAKRVLAGFVPADMDDKWFIYFEDGHLLFHRSWTGICIYRAKLQRTADDSTRVPSASVNRNPSQYKNTNTEFDRLVLSYLLEHLLAGRNVPLPKLP
jgi:hypothetical protein